MQSNQLREKRVWDFYADGFGEILSFNEETVTVKKPKDAHHRCSVMCTAKNNNAKDVTLRTHRKGR